jgi:hypothetical protein
MLEETRLFPEASSSHMPSVNLVERLQQAWLLAFFGFESRTKR